MYYGDVEVVVLDEADTMFDRGFGPEVRFWCRGAGLAQNLRCCFTMTCGCGPAVRNCRAACGSRCTATLGNHGWRQSLASALNRRSLCD